MVAAVKRRMLFASRLAVQSIFQDIACPHCASARTIVAGRKWAVMQVRRCAECALLFRWPKDSVGFNARFYEASYEEGIVTELPHGNEIDLTPDRLGNVDLLSALVPIGSRVLDFGCSWGYLTDAIRSRGYDAVGFEISSRRAQYGREKFALNIFDNYSILAETIGDGSFDAIFSSHVLEHLPALGSVFKEFHRLLRPGGQLLILVPNCGNGIGGLRGDWKPIVGEKHSMAFDTVFFRGALPRHGFSCVIATANGAHDYGAIAQHFLRGESSAIEEGSEIVAYGVRA
jgi:SAM-dependent methyltransferase